MDLNTLNKRIWELLSKYKNIDLDLTKYGYKEYYTILQYLEFMKSNKFFCIEYEIFQGCSTPNCNKKKKKIEFFSPSINFNEEYLTQYNVTYLLEELFQNTNTYCTKCQWRDGVILKNRPPKYFKNFTEIKTPKFLF